MATRRLFCTAVGAALTGCAGLPAAGPSAAAARAELGGSGRLRAAINYGNPILAARGADGAPGGVRLLPGRFMVIHQAMGVPKGRTAAQAWLSA